MLKYTLEEYPERKAKKYTQSGVWACVVFLSQVPCKLSKQNLL